MKPHPRVLVVDDDPAIGRLLRVLLGGERYRVLWRRRGAEGLAEAAASRPDAVVLELDLPDTDGFSVLAALREWSDTPVLVLSARGAVGDIVRALDAGADDYLAKPFAPEELAARLRVLLRGEPPAGGGTLILSGTLRVDLATRAVTRDGRTVALTATEEALLWVLARHAGQLVPSERLVRAVWGACDPRNFHNLHVQISRLRSKLGGSGAPGLIRVEAGVGYSLLPVALGALTPC